MTSGDQYGTPCPHCDSAIDMEQYHDLHVDRQFYCPECREVVVIDAMVTTFTLATLEEYQQCPHTSK